MKADSNKINQSAWSIYYNSAKKRNQSTCMSNHANQPLNEKPANMLSRVKFRLQTFCGFICFLTCKSQWKFHTVQTFTFFLGLMALFTQMIQGGYISAIVTSIQTHFNFSTSKVGFILSSYDIMSVLAIPILSYMGTRYNKSKIIGICGFSYVLGAILFTFPYFFTKRYNIDRFLSNTNGLSSDNPHEICRIHTNTTDFPTTTSNPISFVTSNIYLGSNNSYSVESFSFLSTIITETATTTYKNQTAQIDKKCQRDFANTWPYYIFILAQLFMSLGTSPIFSLGITYICDNLRETYHAFCTGIIYGTYALGPAVGYLSASFLLSKWININEQPPVNENDSRWVGLWYMGFLISASIIFIVSIVLITFPEAIKRETIMKYNEKKKARKDANKLISISDSNSDLKNEIELNDVNNKINVLSKRRLETIEETGEMANNKYGDIDDKASSIVSPVSESTMNSFESISLATISNESSFNQSSAALFTIKTRTDNAEMNNQNLNNINNLNTFRSKLNNILLKIKGFLKCVFKLVINFRYTLLVLIISIECILIAGFTYYMVLYTESVYQVSSSRSSILVGLIVIPAAIFGSVVGGLIVKKFDLNIEGCTRLIIVSSIFVIAGIFALLFVICDGKSSKGINEISKSFDTELKRCNMNCNCESIYFPICEVNEQVSYVSPCYAGCKKADTNGFYECECISNSSSPHTAMAKEGKCSKNCNLKLAIFLAILFIVVATESLCVTPSTMLILKLIDKPLQPLALGLNKCINIIIAYIPSPIVLSQVIDKTCLLWSNNQCVGDKGTCLEYDAREFHYMLFGISAGVKVASSILLVIFSLYIHKTYIRKRHYRSQAILNHDITSVLTPKQKYRIDSHFASSDDSSSVKFKNSRKTCMDVILTKHASLDDNFTSFDRSQTPDYFLNVHSNVTNDHQSLQKY